MSFIENSETSHFDKEILPGIFFKSGNQLTFYLQCEWTRGVKQLRIAFPSGTDFPVREVESETLGYVYISIGIELPLVATCDEAYNFASHTAKQFRSFTVRRIDESRIEIRGRQDSKDHVLVTYDNDERRLADICDFPANTVK